MFEVGRICIKTAGRDSNKKCIVIEKIDDIYVLIDGSTRRKKVNIKHLEPTQDKIELKSKNEEDVKKACESAGIEYVTTKPKPSKPKPMKKRKEKTPEAKENKLKKEKAKQDNKNRKTSESKEKPKEKKE